MVLVAAKLLGVITMRTTKRTTTKTYNGFAIPLQPETELGNATLIVEDEESNYEPIGIAISINEAKEMAQDDFRARMRSLEHDEDPGLCPYQYKLWARGIGGTYRVAASWLAMEL
jgi:hypothetical protein